MNRAPEAKSIAEVLNSLLNHVAFKTSYKQEEWFDVFHETLDQSGWIFIDIIRDEVLKRSKQEFGED